jgi:hypothetical protein
MLTSKLLPLSLLISVVSCSSIVNGTRQIISINSNVKGADVIVDGRNVGKTPFTGKVKRGSDTAVTLQKEGYSSKTIIMSDEVAPAFWANGLFFYGFGFSSTTDYATGAMYKYSPASYSIDLEPVTAGK